MRDALLVIETDEATASRLHADLAKVTNDEVVADKREGLGGTIEFAVLLQVTAPILAAVSPFVVEWVRQKKVRRLRLGDFEIENPTHEQVQAVMDRFLAKNPNPKN